MFKIRRIYDASVALDKESIRQVQEILREQFPGLDPRDVAVLPDKLQNPFKDNFRYALFVAENEKNTVVGFALVSWEQRVRFMYLDYVSTASKRTSRGIGGALYERVREEARSYGAIGIFCECLPDEPQLCPDPAVRKQNAARLKFYERYGAYPIANTDYETPTSPGSVCPPYLVFDDLGKGVKLGKQTLRSVIKAVLEQKYPDKCDAKYIKGILDSVRDDPVKLRPPRYGNSAQTKVVSAKTPEDQKIPLIINEKHDIHHVRERGYVEAPIRIRSIMAEISKTDYFREIQPRHFGNSYLEAIHDKEYIEYFRRVCDKIGTNESVYPYVFPIRNPNRRPRDLPLRAGYYCIDTFTPLNKNAFLAARRAIDCSLTAAEVLLKGSRISYALVRPPGHHAERRSFGGFCYFGNAACAAQFLCKHGKVAILDVDYHHGNSQQDIFYNRSDVLTVSIHGEPRIAYPYFSGFAEERGEGPGEGFNLNLPLREDNVDGSRYRQELRKTLKRIEEFAPTFLVLALGLDPAKGDPTGSWSLLADDFRQNGSMIGALRLPTVVIQEGGYKTRTLGKNALAFFEGLRTAVYAL